MSDSTDLADSQASSVGPASEIELTEMRLDPAHGLGPAPAGNAPDTASLESGVLLTSVVELDAEALAAQPGAAVNLVRQVHSQAAQLAEHLRERQADLDRREAQSHARVAGMENEVRGARVWLELRQHELTEREAELARRDAELSQRETALAAGQPKSPGVAASQEMKHKFAELAERARQLDSRQSQLDERDAVLTAKAQRLAAQQSELEDRHRDLDRRQSQIYQDIEETCAGRAQVLADRAASEQVQKQLAGARRELEEQRRQIQLDASELGSQRAALDRRAEELASQADDMALREARLAQRLAEIQAAVARFERLGIAEQRLAELQAEGAEYQARRTYLDDAEALLAQQQADLESARRQLEVERRSAEELLAQERRRLAEEQESAAARLADQRTAWHRRRDQLDAREAALGQLQQELASQQRETIEMRLATEELWAQLSGPLAPASLTRSLAQIRTRLAEHYRQVEGEQLARRKELDRLKAALAEEHQKLISQKNELERAARLREEELDAQAARLAAREEELDRQLSRDDERERRWQIERRDYERRIRQLLAQLRRIEPAAAA